MSKCAREECGKTVYPIEELKCLDKIWHKGCFKCTSCGMTLNMKTYKGYDKKPYCDAHYPKTMPSVITDTPEMKRLAENTKFQSQVQYHAEYEKMKGTKMQIVDDPEIERHKKNTMIQSQAQYHGETEKKKQQDSTRPTQELTSNIAPSASISPSFTSNENLSYSTSKEHLAQAPYSYTNSNGNGHRTSGASYSYGQPTNADSPYSQRLANQGAGTIVYSSEYGGQVETEQKKVGSIADYDPMNNASAAAPEPVAQQQPRFGAGAVKSTGVTKAAQAQPQAGAQGGKAADKGFTVRALYDYNAADKDEVSFLENDVIVNCQKVDDGWFTGTVQRTLLFGMLPANYVEKVNQPTGMFKLN